MPEHMTPLDYHVIEELLTDDERTARDRARRLVQQEVMQEVVPCHRAAKFPEHLTPRMGALGFYAPQLKEYGCAGLSYTAYGLIMQELERADSLPRCSGSIRCSIRSGMIRASKNSPPRKHRRINRDSSRLVIGYRLSVISYPLSVRIWRSMLAADNAFVLLSASEGSLLLG